MSRETMAPEADRPPNPQRREFLKKLLAAAVTPAIPQELRAAPKNKEGFFPDFSEAFAAAETYCNKALLEKDAFSGNNYAKKYESFQKTFEEGSIFVMLGNNRRNSQYTASCDNTEAGCRNLIMEELINASVEYNMHLPLLYSIFAVESRWKTDAENNGSIGLGQVRDVACVDANKLITAHNKKNNSNISLIRCNNLTDYREAIKATSIYFMKIMNEVKAKSPSISPLEHIQTALAQYNVGSGNFQKDPFRSQGLAYADRVLFALHVYRNKNKKLFNKQPSRS